MGEYHNNLQIMQKVISESRDQEELPGRTEITRETSREDAIAATRHFFSVDTERRSATDVPVTTTVRVTQTDTPPVTSVPCSDRTSGTRNFAYKNFPPSGLPPRPTATATLRPRTLVQRMSEGQIEEQSRDDEDSEENDTLEPLVIEGLPEELGPEWRVIHPFDIPGVRFPTEDTPPNHRRLAENDTLVELIQTAEYLEDAPSWEQRRFYPLRYGDPYYRGCGRGHGRGRGRGWLSEDVRERDTGGGRGRFHFHGNGRNGQYRNGFASTQDEGRRDIRIEMPPEPEPSRFLDWSSMTSPSARTSPHGVTGVPTEPNENAKNQLNVPTTEETRQEIIEVHAAEGVVLAAQTDQLRENQNIPARPALSPRTQRSNLESIEEHVDIIPPMLMQSARSSLHADNAVLTRIVPCESSTNDDLSRSSQRRSHDVNIEGISSIRPVDSSSTSGIRQIALDDRGSGPSCQHEGIHLPRTSTVNRRDSSDSSDSDRFQRGRGYSHQRGRPPERERYPS